MFTQRTIKNTLAIFCLLFGFTAAYAATLHVPTDYETIQDAIDAAEDGDTVLVADGVYFGEGNRDIDFKGKAITVKSENGPKATIIHCANAGRGFIFQSGEDKSSVISGFTIMKGQSDNGGAICCKGSSPTIENTIITNNHASDNGGGIYCYHSFPTISNNLIMYNYASEGGGIFCRNNSSPTISNNLIIHNFANTGRGGGIFCYHSSPTVINNVIANNSAESNGGGIYGHTTKMVVINTIIWSNKANNEATQIWGGGFTVIYSDIEGGWNDVGNIDAEPLFVDQENGDYHLKPDSPCIDAGNPGPQHNDPDGTRNDMGAYGGPNAIVPETQPVISEISPDHGSTAGGTEITITGENFVDDATVKFGENIASDITVVSETKIKAKTPPTEEVGTVDVAVINPNGQSGMLRDAFTYETETSGSFMVSLHSGLNMISLPVKPQTPYNARTLAEELDASIILKYDSINQEFVPYIPGHSTGDGFPIEGGQGYIVNVLEDTEVTFSGRVWDNTTAPKKFLSSDTSHCVWAFVVAGKIPVELRNRTGLTISVKSRKQYRSVRMQSKKKENQWFSVAFVNAGRNAVIEAGDLLEISVTESDRRLVTKQQIVIKPDELAQAYKLIQLRYNPIPEKTRLLQNYPNPFNPETWIPFQLAEKSDVKISIYDISGNLVREIKLGECPAGLYISQDKAAHWNGRNNSGERVSSGVYFYTIYAGKYQSTRRMTVVK